MSDDHKPSRPARAGALLGTLAVSAVLGLAAQDAPAAAATCPAPAEATAWDEQFAGSFTPGALPDDPDQGTAIICTD